MRSKRVTDCRESVPSLGPLRPAHRPGMGVSQELFSCLNVPQLDLAVTRSRDEALAVPRDGHISDGAGVAVVGAWGGRDGGRVGGVGAS